MTRQVIEPILIANPQRGRSVDEDIELLARWMDNVFEIPGTGIRFGLDSIIVCIKNGWGTDKLETRS